MSDTIAAIATPFGEAGISLIRISGPESTSIASTLFYSPGGSQRRDYTPQKVYFGEIRDPAAGEQCVDEVLLTFFKAPKSYTVEDVIEITAHGSVFGSTKILQLILDQGARPAEPGEFTRRAFLNGRIDLSQAEAVADLIEAASDRALRSAVSQLKGDLSSRLNEMYDRLLAVLAQLEAALDFSEEGLTLQNSEQNLEQVRQVRRQMETLIETYRQGKIFREGAQITLVGKPNVGKSSILNALLREERAIVTALPGTTRDTLEERLRIKDIHIKIIDSAGLRADPEIIEKEGMHRARAAMERADLVLMIFDGSQPLDDNDHLLIAEVGDKPKQVLINKSDLPRRLDMETLQSRLGPCDPIVISAKNMSGLDELCDAIYQFVMDKGPGEEAVVITRERHRDNLVQAESALRQVCESMEQGLSEELVAVDINIAMERLGTILGKTFAEELLDKIFGEFCIGK